MKYCNRIIVLLLIVVPVFVHGQPSVDQPWSVRMAESIMSRHPGTYGSWDYVTGTVLKGFEELWRARGDDRYFDYIKNTVDMVVNEDGSIDGYRVTDYNIDEINEGRMVLLLYKETGLNKYKLAADLLRSQLANHPRTNEGGFWHKQIYPYQMWLDGLYMGSPFYAEYGLLFNEPEDLDDVVFQLRVMENHARDPETGLLYHGWDESGAQAWADPITGCSPSFWGRAIGWYAMALVDVLDYLPSDHVERDSVTAIIQRLAEAMFAVQDESSGVWWQVVDQGGREGNYLESSVSCMIVYAMAKAIRLGYLDSSYLADVIGAYEGILSEFIDENADESIDLTQTCAGAGLGGNPYRDGTYEYYVYQTIIRENDGKALGPFITASLEIERLGAPSDLQATTLSGSEIELQWTDNAEDEDGFSIERDDGSGFSEMDQTAADVTVYNDQNLQPLTTYHYRVRYFIGTQYSPYSNRVSATTLAANGAPAFASDPKPSDGAEFVPLDVQLAWEAGTGATSHDVYFGTSDPPDFKGNQDSVHFDPGILSENTTYYWRIDEVNASGTTTGVLWQFTTIQGAALVGYWALNEGAGSIAVDSTVSGNDGTLTNMNEQSWVSGLQGSALQFDGIDDYVRIADDEAVNFAGSSFSISFWLKQSNTDGAMRYVIKGTHSSPGSGKRYEVFHHQNQEVRFAIDDNVVKTNIIVPNTNFTTGKWVHVVAVRNASEKMIYLYANNQLEGSNADSTGDISQNEDLLFGVSPDEENTYFNGMLDDIRLFNYALSESEIADLYDAMPTAISGESHPILPTAIELNIFPNPFNPGTTIHYSIPRAGQVILAVYDILGREVDRLVDERKKSGKYSVKLNAEHLASGIYICRLTTSAQTIVKKMILLK